MAEFLRYLSDSDRQTLLAAAPREGFAPDAVILAEGERRRAIFVLESGHARVERHHAEFYVEIARLSPGDVFGEMSFLEDNAASASVVAEDPCEVRVFDGAVVEARMESDPGFAGRFYRSLAEILSQRLRETTVHGIAEYAWGGNEPDAARHDEEAAARRPTEDLWGGGSPLREFLDAADGGEGESSA